MGGRKVGSEDWDGSRSNRRSAASAGIYRAASATGRLTARALVMPEALTARTPYVRARRGGAVSTHIAARSGIGDSRVPV